MTTWSAFQTDRSTLKYCNVSVISDKVSFFLVSNIFEHADEESGGLHSLELEVF